LSMLDKEKKTPGEPWKILSDHHGPPYLNLSSALNYQSLSSK